MPKLVETTSQKVIFLIGGILIFFRFYNNARGALFQSAGIAVIVFVSLTLLANSKISNKSLLLIITILLTILVIFIVNKSYSTWTNANEYYSQNYLKNGCQDYANLGKKDISYDSFRGLICSKPNSFLYYFGQETFKVIFGN